VNGFHLGYCVRVAFCVVAYFSDRCCFVWRWLLDVIRLGRRRSGKLRSFFSCAIAPNTFLREVPLTLSVRGSAWSWQTLIYLVRIPHRKGHSIQRVVFGWLGDRLLAQATASTVTFELAQTGGISSCGRQLGSNNR